MADDTLKQANTVADLIDLTRAEDLTEADLRSTFQESARDNDIIGKLKGPGAHLLEGPRGVGKSTMLRKAELELDENWAKTRTLGVYVNFKASLLLRNADPEFPYSPFVCWVGAKILEAFHDKCRRHAIVNSAEMEDRYRKTFGITRAWNSDSLSKIVNTLQKISIDNDDQAVHEHFEFLKSENIAEFANPEGISRFIKSVIDALNINRVIFLFDEAAHTFDEDQQKAFFNFFKIFHGDKISLKAAVYPGITSYGGNFEVGHDAVKIQLVSFEESTAKGRSDVIKYFRGLIEKRVKAAKYGKLLERGEALDLAILCSNGNPRTFLQIVSKMLSSGEISKRSALKAISDYILDELTQYHLGLKDRLPKFRSHIELGMSFVKGHLIPELQKKNEGKPTESSSQSIYFTVDDGVSYKIRKALGLLEYSGILAAKSNVKTAKRKQAKRYSLHLGFAAADKVFHSRYSRDPDIAFKQLSSADYREFYANDSRFSELLDQHPGQDMCPNGHIKETEGQFCPICGAKFSENPVISLLLDRSVNDLSLSEFLKGKLATDLKINTVRDLLRKNAPDLMAAPGIGPVRSRQMLNAGEEFISG
ncbi:ORC-CDC6 family AAA ATPase [Rhizobium leguminosarum]